MSATELSLRQHDPDAQGDAEAVLDIRDLRVAFRSRGRLVHAVDGVSLRVDRAQTVALVGESGCGKTATALSILGLIPASIGGPIGGQVIFHDASALPAQASTDLLRLDREVLRDVRGRRIAMIFQEPMTALNPVLPIGEQIAEVLELHEGASRRRAWQTAEKLLRRVGIPDPRRRLRDFPHQLSGGMRQRVMIAMALACRPALLIADEPTTALDPTVQQQILKLLGDLQAEFGMSILLITHDLGVVAQAAETVYVMYAGRIVEHGGVADVLQHPLHPYTQGLLRCMPRLSHRDERLPAIGGAVADLADPPTGCRFHPRCTLSSARASMNGRVALPVNSAVSGLVLRRCVEAFEGEPSGQPALREHRPDHFVACWEA